MNAAIGEVTESEINFSESVRMGSAAARITQGDVAKVIGVAGSQVSQRMKGRTKWTLREMHAIAALLGVNPVDMLGTSTDWLGGIKPDEVQARLLGGAQGRGGNRAYADCAQASAIAV